MNTYKYVSNDPIQFIDFMGLWGVGVIGSGAIEAGLGGVGAGAQGSVGGGMFVDGQYGQISGFTGGGAFAGYPDGPSTAGGNENVVMGGFAGIGAGLYFTNADTVLQLQGVSETYSFNLGIGPIKFSSQFSVSVDGTWMGNITVGPGFGIDLSHYCTNTEPFK